MVVGLAPDHFDYQTLNQAFRCCRGSSSLRRLLRGRGGDSSLLPGGFQLWGLG